jgi:hypothetical protein
VIFQTSYTAEKKSFDEETLPSFNTLFCLLFTIQKLYLIGGRERKEGEE